MMEIEVVADLGDWSKRLVSWDTKGLTDTF